MNRDFEREYIMAVDSGYQKSLQWFIQEAIERNKLPPQAVVTKDGIKMTRPSGWDIDQAKEYLSVGRYGTFSFRHFLGGAIEEVERLMSLRYSYAENRMNLEKENAELKAQLKYAEEIKTDAV